MTTWIVGDIHGCAEELSQLIHQLGLSADDQLVSCGDLFHRGPDPAGVMDLMLEHNAKFILGNHERALLNHVALDPQEADCSDRPPLREHFSHIEAHDLGGDGEQPCLFPESRRRELLVFLQSHHGYYLRHSDLPGAPTTHLGGAWTVVHAGVLPGLALEEHSPFELTRTTRLEHGRHPWWYEEYTGDELILYGHTTERIPKVHRHAGRVCSVGLDTACVYGGRLTAYAPELDEFAQVPAVRTYAA